MLRFRATVVAACIAAPALAGCGSSGGGVDEARVAALTAERDAARMALEALRESLETAQEALGAATAPEQRVEARQAVTDARADLAEVRQDLAAQDDSAAKTAAADALAAVDTALALTVEALAAPASASGGVVAPANMHTTLDRAQTALDDAQAKLKTALAAGPSAAVRGLLSQAQATLSTAQVSLVPLLRRELADAETEAAAQLARAEAQRDSERERAAAEKARADREKARADAEKVRADSERERAEAEKARADAEKARADEYDPRVSLADALAPQGTADVPRGVAQFVRTPRTDTGEDGWAKLDIRTDPVPWAEGKKVSTDGGLVATDEFPLRSLTLRAGGRHPVRIQGDDGTPCDNDVGGSCRNTDGVLTSSLRLSEDGAEWKFGGEGIVYYDMQRTFDYYNDADGTPNHNSWWRYGPDGKLGDATAAMGETVTASHARDLGLDEATGTLTAEQATALQGYTTDNSGACWRAPLSDCGDWAHDDITVNFGSPSQSPQGEPAWYWKVQAPLTQEQRAAALPTNFDDDRRGQELGTYELWLSNYGGFVAGEDTADTGDDRHAYLEYAAYGLSMFFDNVVQTPAFLRPQAFALGYDAFRDAEGMKTTDVTTSIAAAFEGHTMARELIGDGSTTHVVVIGSTPLRGDIALNACIGAAACTSLGIPITPNRISGMISNLEMLRHDGVWVTHRYPNIEMMEGDIAADGSFGGALGYPKDNDDVINSWDYRGAPDATTSQYGGNFYGPRGGVMEAAGWWWVEPDPRDTSGLDARERGKAGIIGSFGAVCARGCE